MGKMAAISCMLHYSTYVTFGNKTNAKSQWSSYVKIFIIHSHTSYSHNLHYS